MRKIWVMMKLKTKMLMTNTSALTGPMMAIGMTVMMRILYSSLTDNPKQLTLLLGVALSLGASMNLGMGAIMMTALPLAEEKEKNTLRTLMTSSVTASDFFIGSLVPPLVITVAVNYLLITVSGVNVAQIDFVLYTVLSVTSAIISCLVGLLIGVFAKSQVNANNIMMPVTLILSMIPTFSLFNVKLQNISKYIYTGMVNDMLNAFNLGEAYALETSQIAILFAMILLISGLFIYYYKRNGLDLD